MLTLPLGVALPSLSLADFAPNKIYSPANIFVGNIFVDSGANITAQQPVLILDTSELEEELARYNGRAGLAKISAERLTDAYLNQFVTGPLNQLIALRTQDEQNAQRTAEQVQNQYDAGIASQLDTEQATSSTQKASAQRFSAIDTLSKKNVQIVQERAKSAAEINDLQQKIAILQVQIKLSTILSPRAGVLQLNVTTGIFVEKGDVLFEVT
jgi:multidrug resistance efflux pump